jgi:GNAT superfamily N-acetyltransferase
MKASLSLQIIRPSTEEQYDQVRNLILSFLRWHQQRHEGTTRTRDYYGNDEFEHELAFLADIYGRGNNLILLALYERQPSGCVLLREINKKTCEMKRMFVDEAYQGKGIGRALAQELIREAKNMGYTIMKLNTGVRQIEALKLYESLGFKRTAPYYTLPEKLQEWLVFMELKF